MATKQLSERREPKIKDFLQGSESEWIIQARNGLQIPAISQEWAYQAWSSDFCEPVELPEVSENRVVDCKYFVGDLETLLVFLKLWSTG